MENNQKKSPGNRKKKQLRSYARYSGIGFQMMAIIFAGLYGGIKLDEHLELETPMFTALFTILSLAVALYYLFAKALHK